MPETTMRRLLSIALFVAAAASATALAEDLHRPDQAPGTPEQVEQGKALFAMCAGCHGAEGEGKIGVGPRLNSANYLAAAPNDFFAQTIVKGRAGTNMVAFGAGMPQENVDALVSYIRSWQTKPGAALDDSPLKGDAATGEKLFGDICETCHGGAGAGYSEAGSGTGIGRKDFLDVASDGFLREVIRNGKDNTAMRSFDKNSPVTVADLTDEEIDSIIQYLRASAW
jgi:cbb3-type cytochrome c oxidase subunit III